MITRRDLVPFWGFASALEEYQTILRNHKAACQRHSKTLAQSDYQETWKWFNRSWPAADRVMLTLIIFLGEMFGPMLLIAWLVIRRRG